MASLTKKVFLETVAEVRDDVKTEKKRSGISMGNVYHALLKKFPDVDKTYLKKRIVHYFNECDDLQPMRGTTKSGMALFRYAG